MNEKKEILIFSFQKEKSVTIEHGFQQPPEADPGSDPGITWRSLREVLRSFVQAPNWGGLDNSH